MNTKEALIFNAAVIIAAQIIRHPDYEEDESWKYENKSGFAKRDYIAEGALLLAEQIYNKVEGSYDNPDEEDPAQTKLSLDQV